MTDLAAIARGTLRILEAGVYSGPSGERSIRASLARAVAGTRLLAAEGPGRRPPADGGPPAGPTRTSAAREATEDAARRLVVDEGHADLLVLNFATARTPAGGFLRGARAQEEALCRCSGLHPCLAGRPEFYAAHAACGTPLHTHAMLHSPGVPWFRDARLALLPEPFEAAVLSAPAPNAVECRRTGAADGGRIRETLEARLERLLAHAEALGHGALLLGAWGCGAFGNDPETVAAGFARLLGDRFRGRFRRVHFAVLDEPGAANVAAFVRRCGGAPPPRPAAGAGARSAR